MKDHLAILSICVILAKAELPHCNNVNQTNTICTLVEYYKPEEPSQPHPIKIKIFVELLKVIDLNEHENTMTTFIQLQNMWNDSRVTIHDNDLKG